MFARKRAADTPAMPVASKKMRAIIGDVQSGKTAAILREIEASTNICFVIVRNVGPDVRQFMNACKRKDLAAITLSSDKDIQGLGCCALVPPRVVVMLANAINVKKAMSLLKAVKNPPFTLIIDEADKIAFSKEPSERSFRAELERLQDIAADQVLVTATMFNFMTLPEVGGVMTNENMTVLQPSVAYCGIREVKFGSRTIDDAIDDPDDDCYIAESELGCDHPTQPRAPASLERWIRGLRTADHPPDHPVFALARMGNRLETIFETARTARRICSRILPIVYTGDGVAVPRSFVDFMEERGYPLVHHTYKKLRDYVVLALPLQQFLTVVKDSRALNDNGIVLVCAGMLAARGVNFTDSTYAWALTHEYFLPAVSTNVTELQQGLRLLGNKPWPLDAFRPVLMTKHSVMRNIEVGCIVQAEAIDRVQNGAGTLRAAVSDIELEHRPSVRYANNMVINSVKAAV
jgi:hypothetical protein